MTVQQLRYVVAVAEAGSITEAARQLFLSQPSLSSAIKELEGEIGRPLFLRGRTGITLTREGMEFLGYARQVLRQMEVLEDRYVAKRPEKVRFGVSAQHYTFAENAFVELVKEYGQDRYEFYYNATGTHQILEDVKNRICELGPPLERCWRNTAWSLCPCSMPGPTCSCKRTTLWRARPG